MFNYPNVSIYKIFRIFSTKNCFVIILVIFAFQFYPINFSYCNYIHIEFDSGVKRIKVPNNWNYDKIPIDEKTIYYYFLYKLSRIDIVITEKQDRIPKHCLFDKFFTIISCSKNEYIYRSAKNFTYLNFNCELSDEKNCNLLLSYILNNFNDKNYIVLNKKKYLIENDWKLIDRSITGHRVFYIIANRKNPYNFFIFYKRLSVIGDSIPSFLKKIGFSQLVSNNDFNDFIIDDLNLFYLNINTENSKTILNVKLSNSLFLRGFIGDKNISGIENNLFNIVLTKDYSKPVINKLFFHVKKDKDYCVISKGDSYFIYNKYRFYKKIDYPLFLNNKSDLNWKIEYIYNKQYYYTFFSNNDNMGFTEKYFKSIQDDVMESIECYLSTDDRNLTNSDIIRMIYGNCVE